MNSNIKNYKIILLLTFYFLIKNDYLNSTSALISSSALALDKKISIEEYYKNVPILFVIAISNNIKHGKSFYFEDIKDPYYLNFFYQYYEKSNKEKPYFPIYLNNIINKNNINFSKIMNILKNKYNFTLKKIGNNYLYEQEE